MSKATRKPPPAAGRFRKGVSGNPKGRPRKQAGDTPGSAFDIIVDRTLAITRGGVAREVTVEEALQHRTYQDALAGSRLAGREVMKMITRREAWLARHCGAHRTKSRIKFLTSPDPGNANPALLLLGIACQDPRWMNEVSGAGGSGDPYERLLLEPWAVQAALDRRGRTKVFTKQEREDIDRCTRGAPETLRWPPHARYLESDRGA